MKIRLFLLLATAAATIAQSPDAKTRQLLLDLLSTDADAKENAQIELFQENVWTSLAAGERVEKVLAARTERTIAARRVDKR